MVLSKSAAVALNTVIVLVLLVILFARLTVDDATLFEPPIKEFDDRAKLFRPPPTVL